MQASMGCRTSCSEIFQTERGRKLTGVFRLITGDIKNKDAVKLTTPTTSLTIRGTKFILAVAADGTTIHGVLEGAVDVAPCGGGQTVRENSGQAAPR
jgi:hypothetical protein